MKSLEAGDRRGGGFSMIELLVTVVLAGIIFAAMVPFFANALDRTSEDEVRVDAAAIAQDRIEQVRLLDYSQVTTANLNYSPSPTTNPFGDGRFGPSYTIMGEARPYSVTYLVTPTPYPTSAQKYVKVSVSRADSKFITSAHTIVQNPLAGGFTETEAEPTELSITVYFPNYTYVKSPGVVVQRVQTNVTPYATITPTPGYQMPTAAKPELTWTGLTGGPNYQYTITCYSSKSTYPLIVSAFHLWSSGRWPIDAWPGGD